ATWGAVSILSTGGSILDNAEANVDVYANELRLSAVTATKAVGASANHLESEVAIVSANVGSGGLFLTEATAITVGQTAAVTVNRVLTDGTVTASTQIDAAQANLSSAGNLILITTAGSIETLGSGGATSAAGNLLIEAGGASSDITLGAAVTNTLGHTSINAGQSIVQNANITASGTASTIELIAGTSITMGAGATIGTNNGNVLLNAANGNILLETISAGSANVAITAQAGNIVDRDADGDSAVDITAAGLILKASNGIGSGANHLETTVNTLNLSAGAGGAFITESNGVTIDALTVAVNRVASDASVSTPAISSVTQEDLSVTGAGHLVLLSNAGDITVNAGTAATGAISAATGNVLLKATAGALSLNAALAATGGNISLFAGTLLSQGVDGDINTSGSGTIDVQANAIIMAHGAVTTAANGNIRYTATSTLILGALSTSADVSLSASSITDAGSGGSDSSNVSADELRIVTTGAADGNGAGTSANHLELSVNKLAASVAGTLTGGLFLLEANGIQIGTLSAINVN
ncbi:MAG: hypothetical protein Q7T59_01225, partial [Candidatus Woesebacteria bacterium]|nr:hypothetical protein [Candidatus Woesebacteria bacterium]